MVEGPGATRNGRKVQLAVGKRLIAAPGDAFDEAPTAPPTLPRHIAGGLPSHTLGEAFTVGKELFLIFSPLPDSDARESCLRLHFGMNGSLQSRRVKSNDLQKMPSGVAPWKQRNEPSLRLYFADGSQSDSYVVIEAWETTFTFPASAVNARNKLANLSSRDVCSTLFNAQDVFTAIRQLGNNMIISDTLLNQDIVPGVGNIIKIESLHQSKIDPRRVTSSLADAELRRLIRHTRKYSMDWLKSGRAGTTFVYNQTTCGTCQGMTVKMQKIGGEGSTFMSRVTFWCTVCQPSTAFDHNPSTNDAENAGASRNASINATRAEIRQHARCPQHGTKSIKLCRVRNGGRNTLRVFFTCKLKGCQFFSWADGPFGNCRCGKKAILRVSKTEHSGGKWFLCCASGDKSSKGSNGCGHFEWANDNHLAPLRSFLTPLL